MIIVRIRIMQSMAAIDFPIPGDIFLKMGFTK